MATPFPRLTPPHFFVPVKMLRIFPYRAQKNVAYNRERYVPLEYKNLFNIDKK
jgi:hypothetical protein